MKKRIVKVNPNVVVTSQSFEEPKLRCDECGDWIKMKPTRVDRFVRLALFWSQLHDHKTRRKAT